MARLGARGGWLDNRCSSIEGFVDRGVRAVNVHQETTLLLKIILLKLRRDVMLYENTLHVDPVGGKFNDGPNGLHACVQQPHKWHH